MSLTGTGNDATAENSPFGSSESSGSSYGSSSKNSSTPPCMKCDFYCDSSHSLEREDSECISDSNSKPYGCFSSENPSTPLSSTNCDSFSVISHLDKASYWGSSLNLEGEGCEWISDSAPVLECFWGGNFPSTYPTVSSLTRVQCDKTEDRIAVEHLLEIADMEDFSADGPLFWPFEGKFNWNSGESWSSFCISPRRRLVFGSRSTTSRIKESKHEGHEAACLLSKSSAKMVTSELNDEKVALVPSTGSNYPILNEDYASNNDLPLAREDLSLDQGVEVPIESLVGLKEFDGHEGLDSEFNGDDYALMLDESLNHSST